MKKIYLVIFLIFSYLNGQAQQKAQYNQYMLNGYLLNPALTGVENYLDVKLSYRNQWTGLEGAPNSFYLTAHGPLNKTDRSSSVVSLPARGKNAIINQLRLKEPNNFKSLKPHQGFGGMIVSDQMGPNKRLGMNLSYAYHLPVSKKKMKLATGGSVGFTRYSLDLSQLDFGPDADPVVNQYCDAVLLPEISLGSVLYGKQFFVGVSGSQLLQNKLDLSGTQLSEQYRYGNHFFLMGGYEYRLNREVALMPSVLVKYVQPLPVSIDANLKLSYLRKMWAGVSYRHQNALGVLAGVNLNTLVNIGYSYEAATSTLSQYNNGSHEIMLGIILNNTYKVRSPIEFKW